MNGLVKKINVFLVTTIVCLTCANAWAEFSASLDRYRIGSGETVQLTLETDQSIDDPLDTTPLEKDFDILSTSNNSEMSITNSGLRRRNIWTLTLSPKRTGKLTVPALEINGEHTKPLILTVETNSLASDENGPDIFLESEITPENLYVQQQAILRVALFYDSSLKEGSLDDPEVNNAVVIKLGKDHQYDATRNNRHYHVVERRYAMFFQESGEQEIGKPVFKGKVRVKHSRGIRPYDPMFDDPFGMFSSTRAVQVRGEMKKVAVRPRPENAGAMWLPAKSVELAQTWSDNGDEFQVGDLITRTVEVSADGLTGAQLPQLAPQHLDDFKVYADKAEESTEELYKGVIGKRVQKIAFIPEKAGRLTLPPITVEWWDVNEEKIKIVDLPAKTIHVKPNPESMNAASTAGLGNTALSPPPAGNGPHSGGPPQPTAPSPPATPPILWLSIILVMGCGWLTTLLLWQRERRKNRLELENAAYSERQTHDTKQGRAAFRRACRENNPRVARQTLLKWAGNHWPDNPPQGLDDIIAKLDNEDVRRELRELDRFLYQQERGRDWHGDKLRKLLPRLPGGGGTTKKGKSALPEFYPR